MEPHGFHVESREKRPPVKFKFFFAGVVGVDSNDSDSGIDYFEDRRTKVILIQRHPGRRRVRRQPNKNSRILLVKFLFRILPKKMGPTSKQMFRKCLFESAN